MVRGAAWFPQAPHYFQGIPGTEHPLHTKCVLYIMSSSSLIFYVCIDTKPLHIFSGNKGTSTGNYILEIFRVCIPLHCTVLFLLPEITVLYRFMDSLFIYVLS